MTANGNVHWWVVAGLLLTANIFLRVDSRIAPPQVIPEKNLFPADLGLWHCTSIAKKPEDHSEEERYWMANCQNGKGFEAEVFVGYSGNSGNRSKLFFPLLNYSKQGEQYSYLYKKPTLIPSRGSQEQALNLTLSLLQDNTGARVALAYWYQVSGHSIPSDYGYRLAFLFQRFNGKSLASQIVRISAPVQGIPEDTVFELEKDLARRISNITLSRFD